MTGRLGSQADLKQRQLQTLLQVKRTIFLRGKGTALFKAASPLSKLIYLRSASSPINRSLTIDF
jgi:hypothetical protein